MAKKNKKRNGKKRSSPVNEQDECKGELLIIDRITGESVLFGFPDMENCFRFLREAGENYDQFEFRIRSPDFCPPCCCLAKPFVLMEAIEALEQIALGNLRAGEIEEDPMAQIRAVLDNYGKK